MADLVWQRIGDVDNFIEPFAGSLAVMLRRPADHFRTGYRVETMNDANHYLVNFWRAVQQAPDEVAKFADWPVMEADLHARHKWLVRSKESQEWFEKMRTDPTHFDAKIAGWWAWGLCCWIGGAWCMHKVDQDNMPQIDRANPRWIAGGRPQLTDAFDIGRGVNSGGSFSAKTPRVSAFGQGLNQSAEALALKVPLLSDTGKGVTSLPSVGTCNSRREWLAGWMNRLADRLRLVRTCYGHWSRVCDSESTLTRLGTTGVFLDPPYPAERGDTGEKSRDDSLYMNDKTQNLNELRDEVLDWCQRHGTNPKIKIAVCGYEGDGYEVLAKSAGWIEHAWEASGGYGNQRKKIGQKKSDNAKRERIWFSPACEQPLNNRNLFTCVDEPESEE